MKCNKGWHTGECCCNCQNQIELFKHPCNKKNKGKISETTGMYACIVQIEITGDKKGILLENKHGFCELHVKK